jgi:long-subunit fatty acid transport protein
MRALILSLSLLLSIVKGYAIGSFVDTNMDVLDLGNAQEINARAMALGGSYTAIANDFSALYYNAAGLSSVKQHELSFSLNQNKLNNQGQYNGYPSSGMDIQNLGIQSWGYLWPIPTTRGGLTFAMGYVRPRNFADALTFIDPKTKTAGQYWYKSEGYLDQYRFGFGLDIAPDIALGLATSYTTGEQEIQYFDIDNVRMLRSYRGWNFEPSLMVKITPLLKLGLSLVLWDVALVKDVYEEQNFPNSEDNFTVQNPYQLKLGLAYQGDGYLLSADYKANYWSEYKYGLQDVEILSDAGYKNENIFSLGAERYLRPLNTIIRVGYNYSNLLDQGFTPTYNKHRASAGLGFLLSGSMSIDFGYSYAFWEEQDQTLYIKNQEQRGMITFGYRY